MRPGTLVSERFEIERVAGTGGMGVVYRAFDRERGEAVALKILHEGDDSLTSRFVREARILAELAHPAIVRYLADGTTENGERWIAMEWLEGSDLATFLAREGLSTEESVALVERLSSAIGHAHQRGIVHRDLKPRNVLLVNDDPNRAVVLDFGIAHLERATSLGTTPGSILGTPGYVAPEQIRASESIDARADVFSLGCILFKCLTGVSAFDGAHPVAVMAKVMFEDAPRASDLRPEIPDALDEVVARALAKDREARPKDGFALAEALRNVRALASLETQERRAVVDHRDGTSPVDTPSISEGEQRVVSVVLAVLGDASAHRAALAFGARVESMVGGHLAAILEGDGVATDLAARAARCALAMHECMKTAPMVLATGRGDPTSRVPIGDAIERAVEMIEQDRSSGVARLRIDEATAGLLDARFEVRDGLELVAVRERAETPRKLLGRPTPIVGRDRELGLLEGLFEECLAEPVARVAVVRAAPGFGKTRLGQELVRRVARRSRSLGVLSSRGDPMRSGQPFGMIAPMLKQESGILDDEPIATRRQKLRARVGRHVSAADVRRVTHFLGELLGIELEGDFAELRAARRDPKLMSNQVRRAFEDFLAAECAARPLMLVLEDLHWSDRASIDLIDAVLRRLANAPLFVLALARPEIDQRFPAPFAGHDPQIIQLGALTRSASERLARAVLGPEADVTAIVARAEGNAFYLEELIRAAAEGHGEGLPETLLTMVHARLLALDGEARRALRAASVFGESFWLGGVQALMGGSDDRLAYLVERELVTPRAESRFQREPEYAFRHALVREAAYSMLTDEDRTLGHRLAAEWLERMGEGDGSVLADHYDRAGDRARAFAWHRKAAHAAMAASDFETVIARAEKAIACGATAETLGELRLLQARAHRWRGEWPQGLQRATEASALLAAGSAQWCKAIGSMAQAAAVLRDDPRMLEAARAFEHAAFAEDARATYCVELARIAMMLSASGRFDHAARVEESVREHAGSLLETVPEVRARHEEMLSLGAIRRDEIEAALHHVTRAEQAYTEAGDLNGACYQRIVLGETWSRVGKLDEAARVLEDARAAAKMLGLRPLVAESERSLGAVMLALGRADESVELLEDACAMSRADGDPDIEASSLVYLAQIALSRGNVEEAHANVSRAVDLADELMRPWALATKARVEVASGRTEEALLCAREAFATFLKFGHLDLGRVDVQRALGEALEASGASAEANEVFAAERDDLLARAGRIVDDELRAAFLASFRRA